MTRQTSKMLAARPGPVQFEPSGSAVIVVDMQNDFGSTGGMFDRAGIDISSIQAAVAPTVNVLSAARKAGIPVVYLQMRHRGDLSDMGSVHSVHYQRHARLSVGDIAVTPDGRPTRVLIEGHWGTQIIDELAPMPGDIVVPKHRFSGFFETPLDSILRVMGARHLIVTGCTTSICVESTIRDAMFRDYSCVLLEDCTGEPIGQNYSRTNHEASLLTIEVLLGWVSSSKEFITAVS